MKLVMYNGGRESFKTCSNPKVLVRGKVYRVTSEHVYNCQTDYILEGVTGIFNSIWFTTVVPVVGESVPVVGESYSCQEIVVEEKTAYMKACEIERVCAVERVNKNAYRIISHGDVYIVYVR